MSKTELVAAMADKAGITKKDAEKALGAFIDTVTEELKAGGKIQLVGFGTFEVVTREASERKNPLTNAVVSVPKRRNAKFRSGKVLKTALN